MNRQNWDLAKLKQQETLEWAEKERLAESLREDQDGSRPRRRGVRIALLASTFALILLILSMYLTGPMINVSPQAYQLNSGASSESALALRSSDKHMLLTVGKDNGNNSFYHSYPSLGPNTNSAQERLGTEKY